MRQRRKPHFYTASESAQISDRWQCHEGLKSIGRVFGRTCSAIFTHLRPHGGIAKPRCRSRLALTLVEREEISALWCMDYRSSAVKREMPSDFTSPWDGSAITARARIALEFRRRAAKTPNSSLQGLVRAFQSWRRTDHHRVTRSIAGVGRKAATCSCPHSAEAV